VPQAAEAMRPLVDERTLVVPLQNGIEAPEQLAAVFGASRVLGGLCRILAYLDALLPLERSARGELEFTT
jgi:2-dehydropantoate 2-reductase